MHPRFLLGGLALFASATALAQAAPFTGGWEIDLRTPAERRSRVECGTAVFNLVQHKDRITGDHSMSTPGCGRLNEGGEGAVKGFVVNGAAVLTVTSGRNGQVVLGTATIRAGSLHWQSREELKPGEPAGDSGLILGSGVLRRVRR